MLGRAEWPPMLHVDTAYSYLIPAPYLDCCLHYTSIVCNCVTLDIRVCRRCGRWLISCGCIQELPRHWQLCIGAMLLVMSCYWQLCMGAMLLVMSCYCQLCIGAMLLVISLLLLHGPCWGLLAICTVLISAKTGRMRILLRVHLL